MMPERYLTTDEVAKIFFGRPPWWLRRILPELRPWTVPTNEAGWRCYTLDDVETIALSLAELGRINGIDAERVTKMIDLTRECWGEVKHG